MQSIQVGVPSSRLQRLLASLEVWDLEADRPPAREAPPPTEDILHALAVPLEPPPSDPVFRRLTLTIPASDSEEAGRVVPAALIRPSSRQSEADQDPCARIVAACTGSLRGDGRGGPDRVLTAQDPV